MIDHDLWRDGKLDAICSGCGRAEAAGFHCSGCGRPYAPGDYRPHSGKRRAACALYGGPRGAYKALGAAKEEKR